MKLKAVTPSTFQDFVSKPKGNHKFGGAFAYKVALMSELAHNMLTRRSEFSLIPVIRQKY